MGFWTRVGALERVGAGGFGLLLGLGWAVACSGSGPPAMTPVPEREAPPEADATAAPAPVAEQPDASAPEPDPLDAAPQDPFSMMDAGDVQLSATVKVAGAVVHEFSDPPSEIVLLSVAPTSKHCKTHDGDKEFVLSLTCTWEAENLCRTMNLKIKNGKVTKHNARARILSAPQKTGETGRLELERADDTNIFGDDVPVLVCD